MVLFDDSPDPGTADDAWLDAELIAAAARRAGRDETPAADGSTS